MGTLSSIVYIMYTIILLLLPMASTQGDNAEKRRLCYQCNSTHNPDCRKPQTEGFNSKFCPPFENFCTIFLLQDIVIRKCSNIIRCPDIEVRCCSCTEDYCNWAENCYEIDDGSVFQAIGSTSLLVAASITTLCYGRVYSKLRLRAQY